MENLLEKRFIEMAQEYEATYYEMRVLFGDDDANNLDSFVKRVVEYVDCGYVELMNYAKQIMLKENIRPVKAAKKICDIYTLECSELITWLDKEYPKGFLNIN